MSRLISTTYAAIIIVLSVIIVIQATPLGYPVKDYFAATVDQDTIVYINSTEFIEIIEYMNSTIWINSTEWINTTEYIYITEYLDYPFVDDWNTPGATTYIRIFKITGQGGSTYRISYYNQLTGTTDQTDYQNYATTINRIEAYYTEGRFTNQQYDCAHIQMIIL